MEASAELFKDQSEMISFSLEEIPYTENQSTDCFSGGKKYPQMSPGQFTGLSFLIP